MGPYSDKEFDSLPHMIMTSDVPWRISVLDYTLSDKNDWYQNISSWSDGLINAPFNLEGNYKFLSDPLDLNLHDLLDLNERHIPDLHDSEISSDIPSVQANSHEVTGAIKSKHRKHDYEALCPFFLNVPAETVKQTMDHTTQFAHSVYVRSQHAQVLQVSISCMQCPTS